MGNHRLARIMGLIQIHVASLESVWLSMLHHRVSLLKWHLFILSIPLLRVIGSCIFDGIIFNGITLPIFINTTCYLCSSPEHSTLFVGRDVRGGSPKWSGALVFRGGYYPRKTSCKSTVGANRLATNRWRRSRVTLKYSETKCDCWRSVLIYLLLFCFVLLLLPSFK